MCLLTFFLAVYTGLGRVFVGEVEVMVLIEGRRREYGTQMFIE